MLSVNASPLSAERKKEGETKRKEGEKERKEEKRKKKRKERGKEERRIILPIEVLKGFN